MAVFTFETSPSELDVRLSVLCGQVFRWKQLSPDTVGGMDGHDGWLVTQDDKSVTVTGDATAFQRLFRIGEDWANAVKTVRTAEPRIGEFMDLLPGLRLLRPSDPVEVVFSFLCSSNNHLPRIVSMVDKLAKYGGGVVAIEGAGLRFEGRSFPPVDRIADISEAELRKQGFGYRAASIPVAASQIVDRGGAAWLESLKSVPYVEARDELVQLRGVGPKLADCVCLFGLGHGEAVPVDTHVWQAATKMFFPEWAGTSLTVSRYQAVGDLFRDKFGELAGWAHQFLFYENLLNWRTRTPEKR